MKFNEMQFCAVNSIDSKEHFAKDIANIFANEQFIFLRPLTALSETLKIWRKRAKV